MSLHAPKFLILAYQCDDFQALISCEKNHAQRREIFADFGRKPCYNRARRGDQKMENGTLLLVVKMTRLRSNS